MNIGKGKTDKISTLFNGLLKKTTPYIPAMYTDGKDTFVSTTKQQQTEQKPTKEQLLSKLKEVDIPEESKAKIEKYAKEDYQIAQAYKLLSSPQLYQNQNVLNSLYLILYTAYSKNTELRNSLLDKYLSTPALYENEVMSSQIGNLISFATNMNKATMADIILSTPELYSSEEFTQNIDELDCISNGLEKEKILNKFLRREALYKNKEMQATIIDYLKTPTNGAQENFAYEVLDYIEQGIVSPQLAIQLVKYNEFKIEPENFKKLKNAIEPDVYSELSVDRNDIIAASRIVPLYNKSSIGEIPITQRNEVLKGLIKLNSRLFKTTDVLKKYFPLIPQSQEEYCAFLPKLATAIGVETKQLTSNQINEFNINLRELSLDVAKLSDEEIEGLEFSQKYSTDDFILDTLEIIAELSESEKSKVFDYFGFEFKENDKKPNGYSLVGYPINIESPEKKLQITDERTLQVIQALRENVIEYSEKNSITSNNEKIGALLNEMQKAFPEIHTMISKQQAEIKGNEALKYSLKVIQKIVQNPQFEGLSDSDKRVMLLTSLFHNIRKLGTTSDSAFDAYLISKKINLTDSEQIKLYKLIKNQNWLEEVDARYISNQEMIARYQNIAYDMQNGNTFELAKMFKKASLESEKTVDYVYQKSIDSLAEHSEMIEVYVEELQATKPILPITKLPKASDVNTKITTVNEDYSTNLKGVYQKDGLTIIRYNEVEDWGSLGFPKGSISSGIKKSGY
ncbi:MAG: hypothetical protein IJY61_04830 [Candidatus Gastranaerophilales bacterium]|nr:hypothetical protein [Candidatus Gastranaerophilales bacterium]